MKLKNFILKKKLIGILNCIAIMLVVQTANTACLWVYHQPEFPAEANKYKKVP